MSIVIIIPARGGSKRIHKKNILPLNGKPLINYSIESVKKAGLKEFLYISTDDNDIKNIAFKNNVNVINRPDSLSQDASSTESVLIHALDEIKQQDIHPEWVMTLQATSPFIGHNVIKNTLNYIDRNPEYDCFMTVTENKSDYWIQADSSSMNISRIFVDAPRRQQDRQPLWEENSAIYLTKVKSLYDTKSILGNKVLGIQVTPIQGLDINEPIDVKLAEFFSNNL